MAGTDIQQDDNYKGTGKWASAIGRGTTEGAVGAAAGAAAGAVAAKSMKDETLEKMRKDAVDLTSTQIKKMKDELAKEGLSDTQKSILEYGKKKAESGLAELEGTAARKVITKNVAIKGAVVVGALLAAHGLWKGAKKSREGHEQFDALKGQVNDLQARQQLTAAINGQGQGKA